MTVATRLLALFNVDVVALQFTQVKLARASDFHLWVGELF